MCCTKHETLVWPQKEHVSPRKKTHVRVRTQTCQRAGAKGGFFAKAIKPAIFCSAPVSLVRLVACLGWWLVLFHWHPRCEDCDILGSHKTTATSLWAKHDAHCGTPHAVRTGASMTCGSFIHCRLHLAAHKMREPTRACSNCAQFLAWFNFNGWTPPHQLHGADWLNFQNFKKNPTETVSNGYPFAD